jgi:microcin C transport system permease protein
MTLLSYLISIPLGIRKAVRDGEKFDTWTSGVLVVGYAIPGFLVAVLLLVLFAGGSFCRSFRRAGLAATTGTSFPPRAKFSTISGTSRCHSSRSRLGRSRQWRS